MLFSSLSGDFQIDGAHGTYRTGLDLTHNMSQAIQNPRENINGFESRPQGRYIQPDHGDYVRDLSLNQASTESTVPAGHMCNPMVCTQSVEDDSRQHDTQGASKPEICAIVLLETHNITTTTQAREKTPFQHNAFEELGPRTSTTISAKAPAFPRLSKFQTWRAPFFMISGLGCGFVIALSQHFMNSGLNSQQVAVVKAEYRLPQAWILIINALLAFLVKASFITAAGTAVVQRQWLNMHRNIFSIEELDNITNLLGDLTSFMKRTTWYRSPILAILALASWILPVAVIVVPGTLTVASVRTTQQKSEPVPQLDYMSTAWTSNYSQISYLNFGAYEFHPVAAPTVYRVMYTSASSGQILALPSRYLNANYHLEFFAPKLKCKPATKVLAKNLTQQWGTVYDHGVWLTEFGVIDFASFVQENLTAYLGTNGTIGVDASSIFNKDLDFFSNDAAHIYFMSNGGKWSGSSMLPTARGPFNWTTGGKAMVNATDCKLYNASYSVHFNFKYPAQNIKVATVDQNVVSFGNVSPVSNYTVTTVDDSIGNTIYGYVFDPTLNAYASIMQSFGRFFIGASMDGFYGARKTEGAPPFPESDFDLMLNLDNTNIENFTRDIEEMFQNFTISLLSEPLLRYVRLDLSV